ncbi:MAG TPA: hypothetical protein VGC05_08760 [Mycobacterium sp.]
MGTNLISEDELDALLTERDPLRDDPVDDVALEDGLAAVLVAVVNAPATFGDAGRVPALPARLRSGLLVKAGVALVATAAAVLAGVTLIGGRSGQPGLRLAIPTAKAAEVKHLAAAVRKSHDDGPSGAVTSSNEVLSERVALSGVGKAPADGQTLHYQFSGTQTLAIVEPSNHEGLGAASNMDDAQVSFPTAADHALFQAAESQGNMTEDQFVKELAETAGVDPEMDDLIAGPGAIGPDEIPNLPDTAAGLIAQIEATYAKPLPNWQDGHASDTPGERPQICVGVVDG